MADRSLKPIGEIKIGDMVWTRHETYSNYGAAKVVGHLVVEENCLEVKFSDGRNLIATPGHRLEVNGQWTEIRHLINGDIVTSEGDVYVTSLTIHTEKVRVVKMTIEDMHTYISNGILSHNMKLLEI